VTVVSFTVTVVPGFNRRVTRTRVLRLGLGVIVHEGNVARKSLSAS
jgi:hypothetical protein